MSDLVKNPEDQFSRNLAHIEVFHVVPNTFLKSNFHLWSKQKNTLNPFFFINDLNMVINLNEPVHEKTNNLGFRPGLTQTGLYSLRSRLEA